VHRALEGALRARRAAVSGRWQWSPAARPSGDAAHLLRATVVQPVGPCGRGRAVRLAGDPRFHRCGPRTLPGAGRATICRFRHLLERNERGKAIFEYVLEHLDSCAITVGKGTIVDATIISAPPSTKNKDKARDPDMHQTRKGNQWYFGMKAHIGVDSRTKIIHAVAANVHDATCPPDLLHGEETKEWGDSAYQGQSTPLKQCAPKAQGVIDRGATSEEPHPVQRTRESRASVSGHQAYLRFRQDTLSRIGRERESSVRDVRVDEPVPGTAAIVACNRGPIHAMKRLADGNNARRGESSATNRNRFVSGEAIHRVEA
jgi:IS5 family transposase